MPNEFINKFNELNKNYPILGAALAAFKELHADRSTWSMGLRLDIDKFKLFYNPYTTAKNLEILEKIINELEPLYTKGCIDPLGNLNLLIDENINSLSEGETKELLRHVKNKIEKISYCQRESLWKKDVGSAPEFTIQISHILNRKKLSPTIFKDVNISLDAPLEEHVSWLFNNIYSVKYPGHAYKDGIARFKHGIQHVTRCAMYAPVFINLYHKYGDKEAKELTEEDLKLLQIAILFHDAAREDEQEDRWDQESATMLFAYLCNVVKCHPFKAKQIAEAMRNKDIYKDKYYELVITKDTLKWREVPARPQKNIYQKIIHDVDCLDIIRARRIFDGQHLDFYKDVASKNPQALDDMAKLINEARSLITRQGDEFGYENVVTKKLYECKNAFKMIRDSINTSVNSMLALLGNCLLGSKVNEVFPKPAVLDNSHKLNLNNLQAWLDRGMIYVRGIVNPSERTRKDKNETNAQLEARKTARRQGIATQSKKANNLEKHGNPVRSLSRIGYGIHMFANSGFAKIDVKANDIISVSLTDNDTGHGKKKGMIYSQRDGFLEANETKLSEMLIKLKLGGSARKYNEYFASHTEIVCNVDDYDFIIYSDEHNLSNYINQQNQGKLKHPNIAVLQAVYLQGMYERKVGKELAIINYNAADHLLAEREDLNEDKVIEMWVALCLDSIDALATHKYSKDVLFSLSVEDMKIVAMYGYDREVSIDEYISADCYLTPLARNTINQRIEPYLKQAQERVYQSLLEAIVKDKNILLEYTTKNILLAKSDISESDAAFLSAAINAVIVEYQHTKKSIVELAPLLELARKFSPAAEDRIKNLAKIEIDLQIKKYMQSKNRDKKDQLKEIFKLGRKFAMMKDYETQLQAIFVDYSKYLIRAKKYKADLLGNLLQDARKTSLDIGPLKSSIDEFLKAAISVSQSKTDFGLVVKLFEFSSKTNELQAAIIEATLKIIETSKSIAMDDYDNMLSALNLLTICNNPKHFKVVIDKLKVNTPISLSYIDSFIGAVRFLKQGLINKEYTESHIKLIHHRYEELFNDYINEDGGIRILLQKPSRFLFIITNFHSSFQSLNIPTPAFLYTYYLQCLKSQNLKLSAGRLRQIEDFVTNVKDDKVRNGLMLYLGNLKKEFNSGSRFGK